MEISTAEELIAQEKWAELRELLNGLQLPEAAEALSNILKATRVLIFHFLSRSDSGELFSYLMPEIHASLLTELTDREAGELLAKLRPDIRTGTLEKLPAHAISQLLTLLGLEDQQEAQQHFWVSEDYIASVFPG